MTQSETAEITVKTKYFVITEISIDAEFLIETISLRYS